MKNLKIFYKQSLLKKGESHMRFVLMAILAICIFSSVTFAAEFQKQEIIGEGIRTIEREGIRNIEQERIRNLIQEREMKIIIENIKEIEKTMQPTQKGEKCCRDFCGDGICQRIVCMACGCPCPETEENCPEDCTNPFKNLSREEIWCIRKGYTYEKRIDESGKEYGVCIFPDGSACTAEEFLNGTCGSLFKEREAINLRIVKEESLEISPREGIKIKNISIETAGGKPIIAMSMKIERVIANVDNETIKSLCIEMIKTKRCLGEKCDEATKEEIRRKCINKTIEEVSKSVQELSEEIPVSIEVDNQTNTTIIQTNMIKARVRDRLHLINQTIMIETPKRNITINVVPSVAIQIIKKVIDEPEKELEIETKEDSVVYKAEGIKEARLLGFIPVKMRIQTRINAENGRIMDIKKPWWAFLATTPQKTEE